MCMGIFRGTVMCYQERLIIKIAAGINRPPPSETISHVNRVPDHRNRSIRRLNKVHFALLGLLDQIQMDSDGTGISFQAILSEAKMWD